MPARRAPRAKEKGRVTPISPAIITGGWMNIPGWMSSGLIPSPSAGTKDRVSKGFAAPAITARKKVSTTIRTALVYGRLSLIRDCAKAIASADMMERAKDMYRSEPSFPA